MKVDVQAGDPKAGTLARKQWQSPALAVFFQSPENRLIYITEISL